MQYLARSGLVIACQLSVDLYVLNSLITSNALLATMNMSQTALDTVRDVELHKLLGDPEGMLQAIAEEDQGTPGPRNAAASLHACAETLKSGIGRYEC